MWNIYRKILSNELFKLDNRYAKSRNMNDSIFFITEEKNGTFTVNIKNNYLELKYSHFQNKHDAELGLKMLLELLGYEQEQNTYH